MCSSLHGARTEVAVGRFGGEGSPQQMAGARARNGWSDAIVGTDRHALWTVNGCILANSRVPELRDCSSRFIFPLKLDYFVPPLIFVVGSSQRGHKSGVRGCQSSYESLAETASDVGR